MTPKPFNRPNSRSTLNFERYTWQHAAKRTEKVFYRAMGVRPDDSTSGQETETGEQGALNTPNFPIVT